MSSEVGVVTVKDIREAGAIVEDLRAHGRARQAEVIEHLIRHAEDSVGRPTQPGFNNLLTTGQAARALGVSIQTIKNWAAEGRLETVKLGGRTMVVRESLLDYLETIRASSNRRPSPVTGESNAEAEQRNFIQAGFPDDLVRRIQELVDAMENRNLTSEEERELGQLERESARISAERLRAWLRQQPGHSDS